MAKAKTSRKRVRKEEDRPRFRGFGHIAEGLDLDLLRKAAERVEKGEPLFYDGRKPEEVK